MVVTMYGVGPQVVPCRQSQNWHLAALCCCELLAWEFPVVSLALWIGFPFLQITLWKLARSFMFLPFPILLVFLAAFDVVCALQLHDSAARLRQLAPSLHGIIKRQADQNTSTTTTNSTSNVNATTTSAVTVPLTLASDKA